MWQTLWKKTERRKQNRISYLTLYSSVSSFSSLRNKIVFLAPYLTPSYWTTFLLISSAEKILQTISFQNLGLFAYYTELSLLRQCPSWRLFVPVFCVSLGTTTIVCVCFALLCIILWIYWFWMAAALLSGVVAYGAGCICVCGCVFVCFSVYFFIHLFIIVMIIIIRMNIW